MMDWSKALQIILLCSPVNEEYEEACQFLLSSREEDEEALALLREEPLGHIPSFYSEGMIKHK